MSGFDFEELLGDVLREDARAEPFAGMERRVLARVAAEAGAGARRVPWTAVAAGVAALGVLAWMIPGREPHVRSHVRDAVSPSAVLLAAVMRSGTDDETVPKVAVTAGMSIGKRGAGVKDVRRVRAPQRAAPLRVAPLQVASLVVGPVEIASLSLSLEAGRTEGEVR